MAYQYVDYMLISNLNSLQNVKNAQKYTKELDDYCFDELIRGAVTFVKKEQAFDSLIYDEILKKSNLTEKQLKIILHGIVILVTHSLRASKTLEKKIFKQVLPKQIKLSDKQVDVIADHVYTDQNIANFPRAPTIHAFRWRADVLISSDTSSKILEPLVILEILTDKGETVIFECSISRFHQLRFAVASLLNEIYNILDKKPSISF